MTVCFFKAMLTEFEGHGKRMPISAKGLFLQEKDLRLRNAMIKSRFQNRAFARNIPSHAGFYAQMTYVVTESCIKCKYTDCVDVCPVDCFREGPNMLIIDPDECIDCTLCVPECPVEAIFAEDDVPPAQREFIPLNAELARSWKPIVERKPAPADADDWAKVKEKKQLIER